MISWSSTEFSEALSLSDRDKMLLANVIRKTGCWNPCLPKKHGIRRKQSVFKPDTGYASRGFILATDNQDNSLPNLNPP